MFYGSVVPLLSSQIRTYHPQRSSEPTHSLGLASWAHGLQILSDHDLVRPLGPSWPYIFPFPGDFFLKNGAKKFQVHYTCYGLIL